MADSVATRGPRITPRAGIKLDAFSAHILPPRAKCIPPSQEVGTPGPEDGAGEDMGCHRDGRVGHVPSGPAGLYTFQQMGRSYCVSTHLYFSINTSPVFILHHGDCKQLFRTQLDTKIT